jgi:hypothetical protein
MNKRWKSSYEVISDAAEVIIWCGEGESFRKGKEHGKQVNTPTLKLVREMRKESV